MILELHSLLNASMGSSNDAFRAGYTPKNKPTIRENPTAITTEESEMRVAHSVDTPTI